MLAIVSNAELTNYFHHLAHEVEILSILGASLIQNLQLDVVEPKSPEDIYKSWLESVPKRLFASYNDVADSARQNLASSFVTAFVNAGFGSDRLITIDGNKWIYRHKTHSMMSATAALGLVHLWDVDGGLTPIDKYLYSEEEYIRAGALLGIGIVSCRVFNECDPAMAILAEYVNDKNNNLKIGKRKEDI